MEKEERRSLVLCIDGLAEPGPPLELAISVRDGKLVIEVPLAGIAERVSRDWENPVKLFDQEAFGNYLGGYLKRLDYALGGLG
jgi:hypothetical protein